MVTRLFAGAVLILMMGWCSEAAPAESKSALAEAPAASDRPTVETKAVAEKPAEAAHGGAASHHAGEAKESGEGNGAEGLNPINFKGLNFPGDLALWTFVVFVVVMAILWKFAWGPIAMGLSKREEEIAAQISEAERRNTEARQLLVDYENKLKASQDEVRSILDKARHDAEKMGQEMLDKAKADSAAERDRSVQQIEQATSAALKELADRSATLAVDLAGKIVGARLDPKAHARLIEEAVANFTAQANVKK